MAKQIVIWPLVGRLAAVAKTTKKQQDAFPFRSKIEEKKSPDLSKSIKKQSNNKTIKTVKIEPPPKRELENQASRLFKNLSKIYCLKVEFMFIKVRYYIEFIRYSINNFNECVASPIRFGTETYFFGRYSYGLEIKN